MFAILHALVLFGPRGEVRVPPGRTVVHYWEKWTGVEQQAIERLVDGGSSPVSPGPRQVGSR